MASLVKIALIVVAIICFLNDEAGYALGAMIVCLMVSYAEDKL